MNAPHDLHKLTPHLRLAVAVVRPAPSALATALSALFLLGAAVILIVSVGRFAHAGGFASVPQIRPFSSLQPARADREPPPESIEVLALTRMPAISFDADHHYSILGLGQNSQTGRQIVWVRDLRRNRIAGFARGQRLFEGPVSVLAIQAHAVTFRYKNERRELPLYID
jgi:hypothetical protein